jgi:hypothetical protein
MSSEQRMLVASFETVHEDAIRHQALAAEVQARTYAVAMKRAYVHFNLAGGLCLEGTGPPQIERGNRELEEVVVARDKVLAAAARDRARHHADLAAVVEAEMDHMGRRRRLRS